MDTLGSRIRTVRIGQRLTQREFGQKIGKSMAIVQRWESDANTPNEGSLIAIEEVLGVNPEWLREGKGEMFTQDSKEDLPHTDIMYVEQVYLYKLKRGMMFLEKNVVQKYITIPNMMLPENASSVVCSKVHLREESPYMKNDSFAFIDISHDLSQQDSDNNDIQDKSHYLVGKNQNRIIPDGMDNFFIIAQKNELNEKDYVIGKVIVVCSAL